MSMLFINVGKPGMKTPTPKMSGQGLGYLASQLKQHGYQARILDFINGLYIEEDFLTVLPQLKVSCVGLSCLAVSFAQAIALAEKIKQYHPDLPVILGGPHPSYCYEEALQNNAVDMVALFEADNTIVPIYEYFVEHQGSISDLKGVAYRENGKTVISEPAPLIEDLDQLPFPDFEVMGAQQYVKRGYLCASMITSRGCVYHCNFCNSSDYYQKSRFRTVDNCLAEIVALQQIGFSHIIFSDENLLGYKPRVPALLKAFKEHNVTWVANIAATDFTTKDLLQECKASGMSGVFLGCESVHDRILESINRPNRFNTVQRVINDCLALRIPLEVGFMIGHPDETLEEMAQTIAYAEELADRGVLTHLAINTPFPGSYQWDNHKQLGLTIRDFCWKNYDTHHAVMDTANLKAQQMQTVYFKAVKIIGMKMIFPSRIM